MKRLFLLALLFVTGLVIFVSCNKSSNNSKECTASPSSAPAPSDGMASYFVNATDPSTVISSITYQGTNGPVTLGPTQLPWNASVFVKNGALISVSAVGSGNGKLTAGYAFNNGTDSVSNSASCSK